MQTDRIEDIYQTRVENYTSSLPQAVRSPNSAQFGLLLSLIASNNELRHSSTGTATKGSGNFALPEDLTYPTPESLYDKPLVKRFSESLLNDERGEFAYLVSHVTIKSQLPLNQSLPDDNFAKISHASLGGHLLEQITASKQGFEAVA